MKQPFFIHRADGRSLAMAGLYEWWHDKTKERDDPDAWLLTGHHHHDIGHRRRRSDPRPDARGDRATATGSGGSTPGR